MVPRFEGSSLVDVLVDRAKSRPEDRAFTFLADGEREEAHLSFAELDRRARAIAVDVRAVAEKGQPVLLLYPAGLDFLTAFLGCLYGGVVAVPAYPPTSRRHLPRIRAILQDASPHAILTCSTRLAKLRTLLAGTEAETVPWRITDEVDSALAAEWRPPHLTEQSLAFLQYTSGSTSSPKGVEVCHGNLQHNSATIRRACHHTQDEVFVSWLPVYHDMGLIGNVLHPLFLGAQSVLMSPMSFLAQPRRWLEAITRYGGTTSGGPNFAYDLCVQRLGADDREGLDLSGWRVAFNGSEPVNAATLDRFADAFEDCGFRREAFYPCYGLAESTLFVTGGDVASAPRVAAFERAPLRQNRAIEAAVESDGTAHRLVSCGRSYLGAEVVHRGGRLFAAAAAAPSASRGHLGGFALSIRVLFFLPIGNFCLFTTPLSEYSPFLLPLIQIHQYSSFHGYIFQYKNRKPPI